ncbi:MAG: M23 family metallopeptidase [Glaciecola sp.]|jgi:murein DD-endopeptidase MepM/ murein hydrolase activator NlpD
MKVSLQLEQSGSRRTIALSLRRVVTVAVLSSLLLFISSRSTFLAQDHIQTVELVQQGLLAQQATIDVLQAENQRQLKVLTHHIQDMKQALKLMEVQQTVLAERARVELPKIQLPVTDIPQLILPGNDELARFALQIEQQKEELALLEKLLANTHINHEHTLAGRPIQKGWLSSYYGMRDDPFTGKPAMHKGIDFAGKEGEPVVATAAGVVTWAGERYGYGNLIEIDHGNGMVSRYGHNHSLTVKVGEIVTKGSTIALMGNTGRSTGAHVHYEIIKNGKQIDPLPYVYRQ